MCVNGDPGPQRLNRYEIDWIPSRKHRRQIAYRATQDVTRLSLHLRDQDPAEVWRTLCHWYRTDPQRLIALAFAGLAALPVDDVQVVSMLDWTQRRVTDKSGTAGRARRAS